MDQYIALVRHFFGRFFDNEFVAQNTEMEVTVTKILALLAAPGVILPCLRMITYLQLDAYPPEARLPTLWFDRSFLICFSMLVMGGVTVLEWDALFPDRRDYASLVPLPIRARTIFLAKIGALAVFLFTFTVAVNIVSTVLFPLISYRSGHSEANIFETIVAMSRPMAAQAMSILAANGFVFVSLVAFEGILLNVLSVRAFRRASVYVQCAMVFALLSLFFFFPNVAGSIVQLKARHAPALFFFPPMWFLGLNEWMLGAHDAGMLELARYARWGLTGVTALAAISYTIAYRRHVRRTLESLEGGDGVRTSADEFVSRMADVLVPHPIERGVVAFIGKTIARSAKHRIFLAVYIGIGCALILQTILGSGLRQAWLSTPLVLSFFVLSGMRYIFTIPSELPANWLFRVSESDERRRALDAARRSMLWLGVAPLFCLVAPFYFVLWSPAVAAAHLLFSVTISILLVEALMLEFWKIPFTCSYPPGKANVTLLWIVYWLAFTTYAYSMASLEAWMVLRPRRLIVFYFAAAGIWIGFKLWRKRWDTVGFTLTFEDSPEPMVRTLGLSEMAWLSQRALHREAQRSSPSRTSDVR
jgi:hypothetical protein